MIKKDDQLILEKDYNYVISGNKEQYDFFKTPKSTALDDITGNNVICISSYFTAPNVIKYETIGYFRAVSDFLKSDDRDWSGTVYMFFKSINDEKEAQSIIDDIREKYNFLKS
jgi:hypothetical protein